ncbi:MAG: hypothetical protein JWO72_2381 [Caulobacteraceae bacterium]|nr:hypothetical protein [Caulobacteraceae bacterium]
MRAILLASATAATILTGFGSGGPALAQRGSRSTPAPGPESSQGSGQAAGSFQQSCRNTQTAGGVLTAECADSNGRFHVSSIPFAQCRGDIGNNNGMLACNGASATGGSLVATDNNGDRRNNNNDRNNGNDALAAGAAGAVAGALLGNAFGNRNNNGGSPPALYAPGYAYPAYGDPRYGDPRYDPRFGQGGYAEGRPAGQWMPIAQRAQWLDRRIDRGLQEGSLDRGEARGLRQELYSLEERESRYRRQGMQRWMMSDLDRRFDDLAARIRYERNDGDRPRYGDGRDGRY